MLEQEFNHNLASKAIAHAGSFRGNLQEYSPAGMIDGDKDTYWATDDTITSEYFQIDLDEAKIIGYIVLQEYIRLGQRVKGFTVEVLTDKGWERVADGSTIGYKRILKVNPVKARSIRINITDSRACPLISNAEVY
jgi:alpha-L-fucosidase